MRLQNIWPLALLILLPVILILYMMKQKAKEEPVASLYLWKEAWQNRRADTPWEKLRGNLLMYLQLLAMGTLILAMTAPYLTGQKEIHSYPIIVIDRSASMGIWREEGKTRLDLAKEEAIRYMDGLDREARITILAVDDAGTICLSASQNRTAAEQAIRDIEPTLLPGDVSAGGELYRSLADLYEDYEIIAYTDTPVDFGKLYGRWVDVASEAANISVDMVSHGEGNQPVVMVKVSNHSLKEDYRGDLSLYLEEELLEVQTIELSHQSSDVFYFNIESIPVEYEQQWNAGLRLMASVSGRDALEADNQAYDILQREQEGKVLLVTEQNTFLEQALRANERLTVYRTDTAEVMSGYDLYLYDGIFPEELPQDGAVFLLDAPPGQYDWLAASGVLTGENAEEDGKSGGYLTFGDREVTRYLKGFQTGYAEWYTYELPKWGEDYLTDGKGNCVGFLGRREGTGQMTAVLGIDLHQGDLPLQSQFPIFMAQMTDILTAGQAGEAEDYPVFPVSESGVMPWTRTAQTAVDAAAGSGQTTGILPGEENGYSLKNWLLGLVLLLLAGITVILVYREACQKARQKACLEARQRGRREARLEARQEGRREARQKVHQKERREVRRPTQKKRTGTGRITVPVLRMLTVLCIILAMAELTVTGRGKGVTTVYLLDVSASCEADRSEGEEFIRTAAAYAVSRSGEERSAVVAFGGDARVEQFVSSENLFRSVGTSPVQTATNLERAVQTGLALIPEEDAGRLVLLTDGGETEGDVTKLIRSVTERQLAVKVVSLSGNMAPENYISRLEVPSDVEVGESFLITVQVESNCSTRAFITLYEGNADGGERQKAVREVELSPGTNQFVFADTRTTEGLATYRAVLESGNDTRTVNNQYTAFTRAEAPACFLILEKEAGESEALLQVLAAAGVQAEVRRAGDAPGTLLDLAAYQAVILLDVPVSRLRQEFLDNLESYVQDYGGGLISVGGGSSYALGGWRDTVLEELLPVQMDLKQDLEVPALSMIYVIDKSGSMGSGIQTGEGYDKLAVAKSAAAEAAGNLRETDRVGVLAFDDKYEWILDMTQADDQETIRNAIGTIQSGGGTSIYPALDAAVQVLEKEETKLKHIILLTDGQDSYGYYTGLTNRMQEDGITLSTVAVGADADTTLLNRLAEAGEGRYYYSENLSELPDIFAQEVFLSMGEYLVNRKFVPTVACAGELLQGVWENGLYPLLGYVAATPKDLATVWLESDEGDPVLSSIQSGLGRTIAWQSDAVGSWNRYYEGTEAYAALWRNLADWVQTDLSDEGGTISVEKEGTSSRIVYRTEEYSAATRVSVVCTDKEGDRTELELTASAPGVYETDVELEENQVYSLFLTRREGEEVVSGQMTGIAMQYSREYQFADRTGLLRLMEAAGGEEIQEPEQVYETDSGDLQEGVQEEKSLTLWFLGLAVLFLMTDIVLQRFDIHPWRKLCQRLAKLRGRNRLKWPVRVKGTGKAGQTAMAEQAAGTERTAGAGRTAGTERTAGAEQTAMAGQTAMAEQTARAERKEHAGKAGKQKQDGTLLDTSALLRRKEERKRP